MEDIKLSDYVFDQIKDFDYGNLTKEQESLVDELILIEELKERYKKYGLCENCKQPNTDLLWCWLCYSKHFQQNFINWTSGNHEVDEFIQKVQLNANDFNKVTEWIEYDSFKNVEFLAKGGFGTIYKAIWKDGQILHWNSKNNQWVRSGEKAVALKCFHNSQNITTDLLEK